MWVLLMQVDGKVGGIEGCCCGRSKSEDVVAGFAEVVLLPDWQVGQVKVSQVRSSRTSSQSMSASDGVELAAVAGPSGPGPIQEAGTTLPRYCVICASWGTLPGWGTCGLPTCQACLVYSMCLLYSKSACL